MIKSCRGCSTEFEAKRDGPWLYCSRACSAKSMHAPSRKLAPKILPLLPATSAELESATGIRRGIICSFLGRMAKAHRVRRPEVRGGPFMPIDASEEIAD